MDCSSLNVADKTIFSASSPLSDKQNALLTTMLASKLDTYASSKKRCCPYVGQANRRRPDDIKVLQQDVEELERRLEAAKRRKVQRTKELQLNRAQREAKAKCSFLALPRFRQLKYEPLVDTPIYRRMEKSVADQYEQLAQVFKDAGLDESQKDYSDARVVKGAQLGTFVRFALAKMVPFALDAVNNAMWNCLKKNSVLDRDAVNASEQGDHSDTLYLKTECMLQGESNTIPVLLRSVLRRFVEPHRVVVVYEGTGDWPNCFMRGQSSSAPIRERGYCVVQRCQSDKNDARASPLSLLQSCVCMTPGLSAGIDLDQPECLQMLSDIVIPSYRKVLDIREQMLENALFDEMFLCKKDGSKSLPLM